MTIMTHYLIRFMVYNPRLLRMNPNAIFVSRSMLNFRKFGFVLATALDEMDESHMSNTRPNCRLTASMARQGQDSLESVIDPGWEHRFGDTCYDIIDGFSHSGNGPRDILVRTSLGRIIWSGRTPTELARFASGIEPLNPQ